MDCVLLGSGGMMPMPSRFLTSLAARHQGQLYIFDAGEGTQIPLKRARLGIKSLRVLAISHLHADHCLGVPGLMMMRAQVREPLALTILGPPGVQQFVSSLRESLRFYIDFPIRFVEWNEAGPEVAYEDDGVRILWAPLKHTIPCLGYRLEEHARPGKFDPVAAQRLGVPRGPLWGELQRGRSVRTEQGKVVSPSQVMGPPRRGRHICYAVDTRPNKSLYRLCRDANLAFLDGMFLSEHQKEAEKRGHMTVEEAARIAFRAGVDHAVLVHISPRYGDDELERLNGAAVSQHQGAEMGCDLKIYPVKHAEGGTGTQMT